MAIIPQPPDRRPSRQQFALSRPALALIALVAAVMTYITWQIVQSSSGGNAGLVEVQPPAPANPAEEPEAAPDSVPAGYKQYSNPEKSFAFVYPEAWGELQEDGEGGAQLSVRTQAVTSGGLSESLQVQVFDKESFKIIANSQNVQLSPSLTPSGSYEWKVADKGKDNVSVGRAYKPQPPIVFESGKALVYGFTNGNNGCPYSSWAFPVNETFVKVRLPSFCTSSKTSNAEAQAKRKADFDAAKDVILRSITVL